MLGTGEVLINDESPAVNREQPLSSNDRMPANIDRVIVHRFDPARAAPGGIQACLRGILRYLPANQRFAIVGLDTGATVPGRRLGRWEEYDWGGGTFWFMPVVELDPGNQKRRLPHSLRLVVGALRYRRQIPRAEWFQAHRMDTAWSLRRFVGKRTAYFIHTQENGLGGDASDSFWRYAPWLHKRLERHVVRKASQVVVFNLEYSDVVRGWNPSAQASPTWFDPDLIPAGDLVDRNTRAVIWVGRLEVPKDPVLAVAAFEALTALDPNEPWSLDIVGIGTLEEEVRERVARLPAEIAERVTLHGRTAPERVAELMAKSGTFLMTSHAGYEGYPRALVEALASGLPSVVTEGADTGNLVCDNHNGFVTSRDPQQIASRLREASELSRSAPRQSVAKLGAREVIDAIYSDRA